MENNKQAKISAFISGVVAATVIGGYFLFGTKNARRNRQKVEDVIEDAKYEVMSKIKTVKKLSKEKYYEIVDEVSDKYSQLKDASLDKIDSLRSDLKDKWVEIEKEAGEENK